MGACSFFLRLLSQRSCFNSERGKDADTRAVGSPLTKVVRRKSNTVTVNAQTGTFLIKAVDKLGNSSANASVVSTVISGLNSFVQTQSFSE